ncbi:MAG: hypothetical protein WDZ90_01550 [Candidatus Paceibacterota bacterium]
MAKNKGDTTLESTNRLLMVIIALLLRRKEEHQLTLREQIDTLNGFGLRGGDIAEILGKNVSYINKELSDIKKKKDKK